MTFAETLAVASLAVSLVSVTVVVATFIRGQRWKDTEDARAVMTRIDAVEDRLTIVERDQANAASKADLAGVRAELHGLRDLVVRTEAGVARIESHLMQRTV